MRTVLVLASTLALCSVPLFAETPIRLQGIGGSFAAISRSTHDVSPVILGGAAAIKPMTHNFFFRGFGALGAVNPPQKAVFAQLLYGAQLGRNLTRRVSVVGGAGAITRFRPVGVDTLPTGFSGLSIKAASQSKWSIGFNCLVNSQVIGLGAQLTRAW